MAPVGESNQSQVEETQGAQPEHASEAGEEISRQATQKRLENRAKSFKQRLTSDINTVNKMLIEYQKDYPTDNISCTTQITEAKDIIVVFDRVGNRWKTVESILDDIKVCIFSSITLQETEIDEKVERVEAALTEYADKYTKLKKDKRETLNRVYDYIEKVKGSNDRASIINNQSNSNPANNTAKVLIFKPQPELKTIFLVKDCILLEFTTWGKTLFHI